MTTLTEYIVAWAQGKTVQEQNIYSRLWSDLPPPCTKPIDWHNAMQLRIKPEVQIRYCPVRIDVDGDMRIGTWTFTVEEATRLDTHQILRLEFDPNMGRIQAFVEDVPK